MRSGTVVSEGIDTETPFQDARYDHPLRLPVQIAEDDASTNRIESAFSIVEQVCRNVNRWHGGDQRERWVGSGVLLAEKQFRRVQGHKQIPSLIKELEALTPHVEAEG